MSNQEWEEAKVTLRENVVALTSQTGGAIITCDEDATKVTDMIALCNGMLKQIETQRTAITRPINDVLKAINEDAKVLTAPLTAAKTKLTDLQTAWLRAKRVREEELRRLEIERTEARRLEQAAMLEQVGFTEEADQVLDKAARASAIATHGPKSTQQRGSMGATSSLAYSWGFDAADIKQVPDRFLVLNGTAVREFMREQTDLIEADADERQLRGKEREAFIAAEKLKRFKIPGVAFTRTETSRTR